LVAEGGLAKPPLVWMAEEAQVGANAQGAAVLATAMVWAAAEERAVSLAASTATLGEWQHRWSPLCHASVPAVELATTRRAPVS